MELWLKLAAIRNKRLPSTDFVGLANRQWPIIWQFTRWVRWKNVNFWYIILVACFALPDLVCSPFEDEAYNGWVKWYGRQQGCINRSILPSGMGARGVSSEHVENMEMFSGSPLRCSLVLQLRCALVLGEPCSGFRRTVLWLSHVWWREDKNSLFPFRHSYLRHFSRRFNNI